jgi:pimeloyl-ACP methyl ester carboxylesterase
MLSAFALAMSRAPDRPVETLVARWGLPPSRFLEIEGQLVHLRDVGPRADAHPIVLLHGTSDSLHTWSAWTEALQAERRVVTLDLPGFGLTGPRADGDYSGDADARFVLAVLDALHIDQVVAGGNSLGGEVAWRMATLAPQRVQRLILVDAAGLPVGDRSIPLGWRLALMPGVSTLLQWVLPRPLIVQGLVSAYGDPNHITDEVVDRTFELTLRAGNRRALVERLRRRVADTAPQDARIAQIRVPTLLLWGALDGLTPPASGEAFQRLIPGSELVVLPGLGHVPQEEDPAASVEPVRRFLGRPSTP